jgi:hypothetical protein
MKEQKELLIVPYQTNEESPIITAKILYKNYEIGTLEINSGIPLPPMGNEPGAPYNTIYEYILIFNEKEGDEEKSLNIASNSVETKGVYQLTGGDLVNRGNLGLPVGIYRNIGFSPEGIRYNLELTTDENETKIILNRIC